MYIIISFGLSFVLLSHKEVSHLGVHRERKYRSSVCISGYARSAFSEFELMRQFGFLPFSLCLSMVARNSRSHFALGVWKIP